MNLHRFVASLSLLGAALILCSCSEAPKPNTVEAAKPAEKKEVALLTARPCLDRMQYMALKWQPDAMPYHMESEANAEDNGQDGKATIWRADFASASRGEAKTFACSGSRLRESPPFGVTGNREYPYTRGTTILTFLPSTLTVDSDAVAKLALDHGGSDLIKRDPKQPVYYELGFDRKANKLLWAAIFGTSQKENKGIGVIDATYPKFLGTMKR